MEGAHEGSFATGMGWVEFARGRECTIEGGDDAAEEMGIKPATSTSQGDAETCFHGFYRRWLELMSTP
jgi:hypothetical protein